MKEKIIFAFVLGSIFGAGIFSLVKIEWLFWVFLFCGTASAILILKNRFFILITIFFLTTGLLIFRGESIFKDSILANYAEEKVSLVGVISKEPDIRDQNIRLTIDVDYVENAGQKIFTNEKVIVSVARYPEYEIGQKLRIEGKIQTPKNFENDNGIEFDYVNFLAKDKIYTLIYYGKVTALGSRPNQAPISRQIFAIKQKFLESVQRIMPSPEAELLGGILLGVKRSLGSDLEENFRKVGLIHIVVLSGYNVTIIAEAIFRFFGFLPRAFSVTLSVISIVIFAMMVGSGATIVRATVMTLLAVFARVSGRTYDVNRALFLAGGVMLFHNPMILLYDPSFQLSFLATLGLIHLGEKVEKILFFIPKKFQFREISSATLSTQITVLPLLISMTGEVSIVAPIVNIITLQVIPPTMLLGFIAGLFGFINQTLGVFVAFPAYLFLNYILQIVNFFANLPIATWVF